jgi:hypothetical protein
MTVSISPVFNAQQFFDNDGNPLSGGKIFQYQAGSFSVEETTWSDNTGAVANSNPIVLDSSGRLPAEIWLTDAVAYNLVLTLNDGTTVLTSVDNVTGVQTSGVSSTSIWSQIVEAPTYVSPTQFLVGGNLTEEFAVGNRVQIEYAGSSFRYGTVSAVSFSSPNTQVTLINDGAAQDSGMLLAYWSLLQVTGRTVDAGAVSYASALPYSTVGTVGNAIRTAETVNTAQTATIDSLRRVWPVSGAAGVFTITPSPAVTSLTVGQVFYVEWNANSNRVASTLNVNGLGAVPIKAVLGTDLSGVTLQDPLLAAGLVTAVVYDGAVFQTMTEPLIIPVPPRGIQGFGANGTFTTPADVFWIRVTCIGGGGGGGHSRDAGFGLQPGGGGGGGGVASLWIPTTPGTNYAISVGAGGNGSVGPSPEGGTTATAGGSTSFGVTTVVATGGSPGSNGSNSNPGYGGNGGTGGPPGVLGLSGGAGLRVLSSASIPYGGAVPGWGTSDQAFGGGGRGGFAENANGSNGVAGVCFVEF